MFSVIVAHICSDNILISQKSTSNITICIFGYHPQTGVAPESVLITFTAADKTTKISCPRASQPTFEHFDLSNGESEKFVTMLSRQVDVLIQQCIFVSCTIQFDSELADVVSEKVRTMQHLSIGILKKRLMAEGQCRYKRGPKLDNKELFTSPILKSKNSVTFLYQPCCLSTSFEVLGTCNYQNTAISGCSS